MPIQVNSTTPGVENKDPLKVADLAIKAETVSATASTPGVESPEETTADRLATAKRRLRATWIPPDIWSQNRPSLLQVIAHAWYGEWGPKTGFWRVAGRLDAVLFGVPGVTILYYVAWIWERPARRLCAILLFSAVAWWLNWTWWF